MSLGFTRFFLLEGRTTAARATRLQLRYQYKLKWQRNETTQHTHKYDILRKDPVSEENRSLRQGKTVTYLKAKRFETKKKTAKRRVTLLKPEPPFLVARQSTLLHRRSDGELHC